MICGSTARYFLQEIMPTAQRLGIRMAYPDDPPWPIFGLPKIITSQENVRKYLNLYDSPYNSVTLCSGSLGANAVMTLWDDTRVQGSDPLCPHS